MLRESEYFDSYTARISMLKIITKRTDVEEEFEKDDVLIRIDWEFAILQGRGRKRISNESFEKNCSDYC